MYNYLHIGLIHLHISVNPMYAYLSPIHVKMGTIFEDMYNYLKIYNVFKYMYFGVSYKSDSA